MIIDTAAAEAAFRRWCAAVSTLLFGVCLLFVVVRCVVVGPLKMVRVR